MRQPIALRNGSSASPSRRQIETPPTSPAKESKDPLQKLISSAELDLQGALGSHDILQAELQRFATRWKEVGRLCILIAFK
jgi:hypothetical protein